MHLKMPVIEKKIILPMCQLMQVHHREPTEERRSLGGLNHWDNLFTEQNCAHTNKLLSLQVLVKNP